MSNDRLPLKDLWTAQPTEGFAMPLDQLHAQAAKLHHTVQRRNLVEYIAAAIVIAVFGLYVFILPGILFKAGSLLVIAGTLVVVWQLRRRATAEPLPLGAPLADLVAFHRRELIRQRDALRSVAVWYLGPMVPGMAVFLAGMYVRAMDIPPARNRVLIVIAICVAVFAGVWALNVWGASRLQKRIDAL